VIITTGRIRSTSSSRSIYLQQVDSPSSNFAEVAVFEQSTTARRNQYGDHQVRIQKQLVDDYYQVRIEIAANLSGSAVASVNWESKSVYRFEARSRKVAISDCCHAPAALQHCSMSNIQSATGSWWQINLLDQPHAHVKTKGTRSQATATQKLYQEASTS
jgi:hypothetical protein